MRKKISGKIGIRLFLEDESELRDKVKCCTFPGLSVAVKNTVAMQLVAER